MNLSPNISILSSSTLVREKMNELKSTLKFIFSLIFNLMILGLCQNLNGQIVDKNPNLFLSRSNGLIPEVTPLRQDADVMKMFLEDDWYIGDVKSFEGEFIINKPMKYEIIRNRLEMQIDGQIMGLSHRHVKSFEWFNVSDNRRAVFLNCKDLLFKDAGLIGFLEILSEGKITLSSHKTVKIFQGNSSTSVTGSHRKDDIFIKEQFYYSIDGGLIAQLPKKRRDILKIFKDKKDTIKQFVNWNGLVFKRKEDLIKIFDFYNTLSFQY